MIRSSRIIDWWGSHRLGTCQEIVIFTGTLNLIWNCAGTDMLNVSPYFLSCGEGDEKGEWSLNLGDLPW